METIKPAKVTTTISNLKTKEVYTDRGRVES